MFMRSFLVGTNGLTGSGTWWIPCVSLLCIFDSPVLVAAKEVVSKERLRSYGLLCPLDLLRSPSP